MINTIMDGICEALAARFGDGVSIYTEAVEQHLQRPCFFVTCLSPMVGRYRGRRGMVQAQFAVQYLPATDEPLRECNTVAGQLPGCLEMIEAQGVPLLGTGMAPSVVDDVLHFFVDYKAAVQEAESGEPMENYTRHTDPKG